MSEIFSLSPARKRKPPSAVCGNENVGTSNEAAGRHEYYNNDRTVVHVDFESKDLQLLRYKARELEEARFVLYKQSTSTEINTEAGSVPVAIRVLVQKRMVQYYFYCPLCGTKIFGSLFPEAHGTRNYGSTKWKDIEETVQDEVGKKALDHGCLEHGTGKLMS